MKKFLLGILFIISIACLGYVPKQSDFLIILSCFSCAFVAFAFLVKNKAHLSLTDIFLIGFTARVLLLFSFPNLSDDIYRFLWDGRLIQLGFNPYDYLPSAVDTNDDFLISLFGQLNSPDYFSVYPPLNQLVFYLAGLFKNIYVSSIVLKLTMLGFEFLSFVFLVKLLSRLKLPENNVMIYWINPLIIIELVGNIHFEAMLVCFFVVFLYYFFEKKYFRSGIYFGLAIGSKLLPLLFGPLILKHLWLKEKKYQFFIIAALVVGITFVPFLLADQLLNFGKSINLYFQSFEFNASLYYLLRSALKWVTGYNQIVILGPFLSLVTFLVLVFLAYKYKPQNFMVFINICLVSFSIYLIDATTIHPWYLALLVMLNVFYNYQYIHLWTYLIVLSYSTYITPEFHQNLGLIFTEYFLVISCFWYFDRQRLIKNLNIISAESPT